MKLVKSQVKTRRFKVHFSDSLFGVVAHHWRQIGARGWHGFGEAITPVELKQLLGGEDPVMVGPSQWDWDKMLLVAPPPTMLAEYRAAHPEFLWLPRAKNNAFITLTVTEPERYPRAYIRRKGVNEYASPDTEVGLEYAE